MPKAEVGSSKWIANAQKSKGLQRLRWYCQVCEKQCRDANGFKCHTQSESHIRQMQIVGEDAGKFIRGFSNDFQRDFIALLRVAHGEKFIAATRFYNEYIRDKEHIHMNATKWSSLTEFAKHLGREGIVQVKEDEKDGLMIAWRDTSAKALERREAIREADAAEARSTAGDDKMLKRMAQRAKEAAAERAKFVEVAEARAKAAEARKQNNNTTPPAAATNEPPTVAADTKSEEAPVAGEVKTGDAAKEVEGAPKPAPPPVKMSFGLKLKAAPGKPAVGQPKGSQSIFKRIRAENGEDKPAKKVKI